MRYILTFRIHMTEVEKKNNKTEIYKNKLKIFLHIFIILIKIKKTIFLRFKH